MKQRQDIPLNPSSPSPSRPSALTLAHLPKEVLESVFSHLILPANPPHFYHLKHAIRFALNSPYPLSTYHTFSRITFPSTTRYYGQLAEPRFLESFVTLSSNALTHLELPQVDPKSIFLIAQIVCPNLLSLSFFDSLLHEKPIFTGLLLQCVHLRSLTIHHVTAETLRELKNKSVVGKLPSLTHLALHRLRKRLVDDVSTILFRFANQLESIKISGNTSVSCACCPCRSIFTRLVDCIANFVKLQSLEILEFSGEVLRKQQNTCMLPSTVHFIMNLLSNRDYLMNAPVLNNFRLTGTTIYAYMFLGLMKGDEIFEKVRFPNITFDIPGLICFTSSVELPEPIFTSIHPESFPEDFFRDYSGYTFNLRHLALGGFSDSYMVSEHAIGTYNGVKIPEALFRDVRKVSIFAPCQEIDYDDADLDIIVYSLQRVSHLECFEISIHAVFEWNMDTIRQLMHLVETKKPNKIVVHVDDLLPPYFAILLPFQGTKKHHALSKNRLVRLAKFMVLLKNMDSVKEVVMEGSFNPDVEKGAIKEMAKSIVKERDKRPNARRSIMEEFVVKLLSKLSKMEAKCNIDLTSVIGWLERILPPASRGCCYIPSDML